MASFAAKAVVTIFVVLALIHFYWALGGRSGKRAAVPEVSGRPAFVPSAASTSVVAIGLSACALLVAVAAGLVGPPAPHPWVTWLTFALALALLARAIGDFRLVGFFKRIRGTQFARLDSVVYAPLCMALAIAVFYVALAHRA